jgi:DNA-binding NtrC family response regulator
MVQRILVADDDERLSEMVSDFLSQRGYEVKRVSDGVSALAQLGKFKANVLITDIQMPTLDGFTLLKLARQSHPECAVVVMTGYGSLEDAGKAKQYGAFDYLQKPFPPNDLLAILDRIKQQGAQAGTDPGAQFPDMIGDSPAMREVFSRILQVANTDMAVLIQGETGTGKELVSTAIHRLSFRNRGQFVVVNCATLENDLFESEVFGHAEGAFTGASRAKEGLMAAASGGTIFLDEIGEISKKNQAKLLRAIESGEIRRLGDTKARKVDARVVAASHVPLRQASASGEFRSDLYFRLAAFTIVIPPLRERREDIPLLARALLKRAAIADHRELLEISDETMNSLVEYDWPGNVRELANLLRGSAVACINEKSNTLQPRHLRLPGFGIYGAESSSMRRPLFDAAETKKPASPEEAPKSPSLALPDLDFEEPSSYRNIRAELIKGFDRKYFTKLLTRTHGNVSKAARIAGLDRKRLREKLVAAGLSIEDFR